jgi:3-deoxy-D-manno-octulosonic-acid transferase
MAYNALMHLAALFRHKKAKRKVEGMHNYWERLEEAISPTADVIWVHAASLGELEQGWPIIKKIKASYKQHLLLLTFSSPSGMDNFNNDGTVDQAFYLPLDTPDNAERFVSSTAPDLAFFIKYEIWLNYMINLQQAKIPIIVAPAVFWEKQIYFKKYFKDLFLPILKKVDRILVQDEPSKSLLESYDFENVEVAGDSRFDRAIEVAQTPFEDEVLNEFSNGNFTLIGGSTWEDDEAVLLECLKQTKNTKLIIAPHKIDKANIARVREFFGKNITALYSVPPMHFRKTRVLIIDNIGLLSRAYRFGDAAFIGGGYQHGLHSTVEAVVYGMPIFFGTKHQNFVEPAEMIEKGIGFEVNKKTGLAPLLKPFMEDQVKYEQVSKLASQFPNAKAGGSQKIMHHVERLVYKIPENYEFA